MATDQEIAQQILAARDAGQIDEQTANQMLSIQGQPAPIDPTAVAPAALQPNPPEALTTAPTDIAIPPVDPALISAARQADAAAQQDTINMQMGYTPPGQRRPDPVDMLRTPAQISELEQNFGQEQTPAPVAATANGPSAASIAAEIQPENMEPSQAQTQQANVEVVEPVKRQIAETRAVQQSADLVQKQLAEQAENLRKQQEMIQTEIDTQDNSVRQRSLPEIMQRGSFGDKIGASIALLLGGFSQGLTGAKTNPVMDFIDRQVAQQADKDKLTAEQKSSLKKQLIEVAQLRMQNAQNISTDQYHKQSLEVERQKLEVERQKNEGEQRRKAEEIASKYGDSAEIAQLYQGKPISPEMRSKLNENQMKSVITINGKAYLTDNPDAKTKLNDNLESRKSAISKLKPYKELVEKGIWRTLGEKGIMGALKDRAAAKTMEQAIVGALRMPYTGPGALNEGERQGLLGAIGQFGLWKLPSIEASKVKYIIHDLESEMQRQADDAGLKNVQVTPRQFLRLKDGRMLDKEIYINKKAEETGKSPDEIAELMKRASSGRQ